MKQNMIRTDGTRGMAVRGDANAPQGTQSVIRAVRILKAVSRAKNDVSLVELCSELGLSKPTVHRILSALISERLVIQDSVSRSFSIGPEAISLGANTYHRSDLLALIV